MLSEAKKIWLTLGISHLYSKITSWERRIYSLNLFLANHCSTELMHEIWLEEEIMMREIIEYNKTVIRKTQKL